MVNEPISSEVSRRICLHMNKDHNTSLYKYAVKFGGMADPTEVEMVEINEKLMVLNVDGEKVEILFDHILKDSTDAHKTLVAMAK